MKRTRTTRAGLAAVLAALLAFTGLSLTGLASADTATFTPVADTWVNSNQPGQNNGTAMRILANGSPEKYGLIQFDVSGIPAGATDVSGTLTLTSPTAQSAATVEVHALDNGWDESSTYSSAPRPGALLDSGTMPSSGSVSFDVPIAGNGTVSFALTKTGAGDSIAAARENAAKAPQLAVHYTTGGATAPPAADYKYDPVSGQAPLTVSFDNISTGAASYLWDFGDGSTSTDAEPGTHLFSSPGTYPVTLTATNSAGSDSITGTVTVTQTVAPPTADYRYDPVSGDAPLTVTFDNISQGATGYGWDFGDGTTSSAAEPGTHTFTDPGTYSVTLTATNSVGSDSITGTVTVNAVVVPPTDEPPTADAGPDQTVTLPAGASLTGSVTDDDPASVTTSWAKSSGPGTVTFADPSSVHTTATFSVAGDYVLTLSADDGEFTATDNVAVHVDPEPAPPVDPDPPLALPYGPDSFFQSRVDGPGTPIDAGRTSSFHAFMASNPDQAGIDFPKINMNENWAMSYDYGTADEPIWHLTGGNTGDSRLAVVAVGGQGFHMSDAVASSFPTGTQDRPGVVIDQAFGYTVQFADAEPDLATHTIHVSNAGIMWHASNGLDYRDPLSDDNRNFTSRGRILDAMIVTREELDAAVAAGTGVGHVLHLFFVQTCQDDGHVHPMVGHEGQPCGWGAEGERIRIKPSVDLVARGLTGYTLALARTLQENGAYIGDNSGSATQIKLSQPDRYTGTNLSTNAFSGHLHWDDFEVVQAGWQ